MNRPLPSHETLISYIGPPIEYSLRDYFSPQELIEVRSHYREYYLERGMNENTLYKGIPELLTRLKAKGYNLYVATCKATYNARDILANFGIADCFIYIQGVEQGIFDKSGVIKKVMDDFNLSLELFLWAIPPFFRSGEIIDVLCDLRFRQSGERRGLACGIFCAHAGSRRGLS